MIIQLGIMQQTIRLYVKPETRIAELVFENPYQLLLLEQFNLNPETYDISVSAVCRAYNLSESVFIVFANLYNGYALTGNEHFTHDQIEPVIAFLHNSHTYFRNDKYPEIREYIRKMYLTNPSTEIKLTGEFFDKYFAEVNEHLDYEETVAFPYFRELLKEGQHAKTKGRNRFSGKQYLEHHTDIESKLTDLKNLLLKHISVRNDAANRRNLLFSLFELEFVLNIHSMIEESILIPLVMDLEKKLNLV